MHRELLNDVSSFLLNDTHTQKIDGKQKKAKIGKRKEKAREREREHIQIIIDGIKCIGEKWN
jgi:hypothetical protein